jgi:hypothetical protein
MGIVAVDGDDRVVGEFIFMASKVLVDGKAHRALRPIAPIVARDLQFLRPEPPALPPMWGMYEYAVEIAPQQGISLFYMLPSRLWARTRRYQDSALFPLWSLLLPVPDGQLPDTGCEATLLADWDESVDRLWQRTAQMHSCSVVRDTGTLRWRSMRPGYAALGVRSAGQLIGVAVSEIHNKQWLICDLVVEDGDEALLSTLAAVSSFARSVTTNPGPYEKISILVTPFLEGALKKLGFERVDYDFPMMVRPLTPELTREQIAPQRWYVSAND